MGIMATWGPMSLLVSQTKIAVLEGLSTTLTLKQDSENDTSGTQPTNTRGRELQPVTFKVKYLAAAGVNPREEVNKWEAELGNSYPLIIGGERFGPEKMKLKQVSETDILLSNSGKFLQIVANITLEEYSEGKTSKLVSNSTNSGSTSYLDQVKEALSATASASDRATMGGGAS